MEFSELIEKRRSIRKYADRKADKELIEKIVKEAQQAPSWKNSQTARLRIIYTDEMIKETADKILPSFNAVRCRNASAVIVTSFVKEIAGFSDGVANNDGGDFWGAYDLGLQNAYLILAAADNGLDTLIMGLREADAIRGILNIPDNEQIMAVIAIGYRDQEPVIKERLDLGEMTEFF